MSDRETCVAKLTEILGTISTANGYDIDLGSPVTRTITTIDSLNDAGFDAIFVEDNGDGAPENIDIYSGDVGIIRFTVPIVGYVRMGASDITVTTAINRLDKAVKKAIGASVNQVIHGVWDSVKARPLIGRSGSENGEYGWFIRPVEIEYEANVSSGL